MSQLYKIIGMPGAADKRPEKCDNTCQTYQFVGDILHEQLQMRRQPARLLAEAVTLSLEFVGGTQGSKLWCRFSRFISKRENFHPYLW
jgi:hypothetical protein